MSLRLRGIKRRWLGLSGQRLHFDLDLQRDTAAAAKGWSVFGQSRFNRTAVRTGSTCRSTQICLWGFTAFQAWTLLSSCTVSRHWSQQLAVWAVCRSPAVGSLSSTPRTGEANHELLFHYMSSQLWLALKCKAALPRCSPDSAAMHKLALEKAELKIPPGQRSLDLPGCVSRITHQWD